MTRARLRLDLLDTRDTPAAGLTAFGAAAGGAPLVAVVRSDGTTLAQFSAFEDSFRGGVRAAVGELDGDPNTLEVVAGAGPGGGPAVKVFSVDLSTGRVTPRAAFYAFETAFGGGAFVAAGDVAGRVGGRGQVVVGAGDGGGPRVRVFEMDGTPLAGSPLADIQVYEPTFTGGVRVAVGELDGNPADGDELVTAAGTDGGPRVRVLRSDGAGLADYFAFGSDFRGGANVTVESTGGTAARIRPDALALDPSQRLQALNTAADQTAGTGSSGSTSATTAGTGGTSAATPGGTTSAGSTTGSSGTTGLSGGTTGSTSSVSTGGSTSTGTDSLGTGLTTGSSSTGQTGGQTSGTTGSSGTTGGTTTSTSGGGTGSGSTNTSGFGTNSSASGSTASGISGLSGTSSGIVSTGVSSGTTGTGNSGGSGG